MTTNRGATQRPKGAYDLDEIDRKISDCCAKTVSRQRRKSRPRSGCRRRRAGRASNGWEEAGAISGYVALLNPERIGRALSVIVEVNLEQHDDEKIEFPRHLSLLPEVTDLTTGEYDYVIIAAVEDTEDYEAWQAIVAEVPRHPPPTRARRFV